MIFQFIILTLNLGGEIGLHLGNFCVVLIYNRIYLFKKMPGRLIPLVTDEVYHIFNRGIDNRPTFTKKNEYDRALLTLRYYRFATPPVSLSLLLNTHIEERNEIISYLEKENQKIVEILSYCLMPNHFHLLIKQLKDKGISKFISNYLNSYTRYFNTKNERLGPLFLNQFKAVRIETDEQLIHVNRYIHLNPYTSYVIKNLENLMNYPWSSFGEYLGLKKSNLCEKESILSFFKNTNDYQKFILNQAEYQRELDGIKHLLLEG